MGRTRQILGSAFHIAREKDINHLIDLIQTLLEGIALGKKRVNKRITRISTRCARNKVPRTVVGAQDITLSGEEIGLVYLRENLQDPVEGLVADLPVPREAAGHVRRIIPKVASEVGLVVHIPGVTELGENVGENLGTGHVAIRPKGMFSFGVAKVGL